MEAIRIEGLTKRYKDVTAVDGLSLTINQGELFSLLGINGAGKTTTIKMLCGLVRPEKGDAFLHGKSIVTEGARIKPMIAISPQETAVAPALSVRENLELMCGLHGIPKDTAKTKLKEMTERFGFADILDKRAGRLSGGWKRRLSIAMALISEPRILFLDEPTLGLDVIARSELWDLIRTLKGRITIVLTTHYMEEAEALSDRVGIMKNGRLLACDTPKRILQATQCPNLEEAFLTIVKEGK